MGGRIRSRCPGRDACPSPTAPQYSPSGNVSDGNVNDKANDSCDNVYFWTEFVIFPGGGSDTVACPQRYKAFSCSTQMSMKFSLLINMKMTAF